MIGITNAFLYLDSSHTYEEGLCPLFFVIIIIIIINGLKPSVPRRVKEVCNPINLRAAPVFFSCIVIIFLIFISVTSVSCYLPNAGADTRGGGGPTYSPPFVSLRKRKEKSGKVILGLG